jgi:hypothetical protein
MKKYERKLSLLGLLIMGMLLSQNVYSKSKLIKSAEKLDIKGLEKAIRKGGDPNAISKDKRFFTRKLIEKTPLMAVFSRENLWMWKFGRKIDKSSIIYIKSNETRAGFRPLEKKGTKKRIDDHVKRLFETVDFIIKKSADNNKTRGGQYTNKNAFATLLTKLNFTKSGGNLVLGVVPSGLYKPRYCTKYIDIKLIHGLVSRGLNLNVKVDIQKTKKETLKNHSAKDLLQKKWFNPVIKYAIEAGSRKDLFKNVENKFPLKSCSTEIRGEVTDGRENNQYLSYYCMCPSIGVQRFLKDNSRNANEEAKPTF